MQQRKVFQAFSTALLLGAVATLLLACSASGAASLAATPAGGLPALPLDVLGHYASATHTATINGVDAFSRSAGTAINGTTLDLTATANPPSIEWGIWQYVPDAAQSEVVSSAHVGLTVSVGSSGWIGIANYAKGVWEFRGPYNSGGGGESRDFINLNAGGYLSPAGNLYFLVAAFDGTSASLPNISLVSDISPPPPPTYTVSGSALDSSNSAGLPGVTVHLNPGGLSTTTNAIGEFSFASIDAGSYTLTADTLTGYDPFTPASIPVTVGPDSTGNTFSATPSGPTAVTYETGAAVVKSLMNANCVSCHSPAGGETPLTTWSQVNSKKVTIAAFVVDVKNMPPGGMSAADRAKFAQWRTDGYQQ